MAADNYTERRKKIFIFSLILLATVGIASFLIATLWQKDEPMPEAKTNGSITNVVTSSPDYGMLISANELLVNRLNSLHQSDNQYAGMLSGVSDKKKLDSANTSIYVQEEILRGALDSIVLNSPKQPDTALSKLFNYIVGSYKSILESRRSISSLRNAISINKNGLQPDEKALLKLQDEVLEKNKQVAELESALKAINKTRLPLPQDNSSNSNISVLKANSLEQEQKIAMLTSANNGLKQANERLENKATDVAKTTDQGETFFKNKSAMLQQKVDALNTELRLAKVDCDLSRVDAAQIISNSKQRKELLSEASGILNTLAKSDDADLKKKVQDKITHLNQVAANSRD